MLVSKLLWPAFPLYGASSFSDEVHDIFYKRISLSIEKRKKNSENRLTERSINENSKSTIWYFINLYTNLKIIL